MYLYAGNGQHFTVAELQAHVGRGFTHIALFAGSEHFLHVTGDNVRVLLSSDRRARYGEISLIQLRSLKADEPVLSVLEAHVQTVAREEAIVRLGWNGRSPNDHNEI